MFRKIWLALAIAQSTVYADDHDWVEATGWEFIFPDEVFIDSIKGSTDQSRLAPNRTRTSKI